MGYHDSAVFPARGTQLWHRPDGFQALAPALKSRGNSWFLLAAYIFFLPVQLDYGEMRLSPADLFLFVSLWVGISKVRLVRPAWSVFHGALAVVFFVGTWKTAMADGSLSNYVLINKDIGLLILFVTYSVITTAATDWPSIRRMLQVLIATVTLQTLLAVSAYFATQLFDMRISGVNYGGQRVSGMLIDPNAFGSLVMVTLVIHLSTYFSRRPLVRHALGAFCMMILALGLLLTLSRSAWIGFVFALLISLPFRPRLAAAYAGLAALAAVSLFRVLSPRQIGDILELASRANTAKERVTQIREAVPMVEKSPLVGIGLGQFESRLMDQGVAFPYIIHDSSVWLLTEFGLLGLAAFLGLAAALVGKGVRAFRRASSMERPLVVGLIGAHFGMFGVSFGIGALYQRHWWLVMALLASSYAITRTRVHLPPDAGPACLGARI